MNESSLLIPLCVVLASGCASKTSNSAAPIDPVVDAATDPVDAGTDGPAAEKPNEVSNKLARWLSGQFDSKEQSVTNRSYFNITLAICPVALPELGKHVLYVEQAVAGSLPYRQRLYVVEAVDDATGRSRVFEPKNADSLVGLCAAKSPPTLAAKDFEEKLGCSVVLAWNGERFEGKTPADPKCPSDHEGATYATSDVTLGARELRSWDRGYDATGKQVWGATAGPYVFVRRTPLEP